MYSREIIISQQLETQACIFADDEIIRPEAEISQVGERNCHREELPPGAVHWK